MHATTAWYAARHVHSSRERCVSRDVITSCSEFYWTWAKNAVWGPLGIGQAVSFFLASIAVPISLHYPNAVGPITFLLWAIPAAVFVATLAAAWGYAPYAMLREREATLIDGREAARLLAASERQALVDGRD